MFSGEWIEMYSTRGVGGIEMFSGEWIEMYPWGRGIEIYSGE